MRLSLLLLRSEQPAVLRLVPAARYRQARSAVAHLVVRHAQRRVRDFGQRAAERCEQALSSRLPEGNRLHGRGGLILEPRPEITEQAFAFRDPPGGAREAEGSRKSRIFDCPQRVDLPTVEFRLLEQ